MHNHQLKAFFPVLLFLTFSCGQVVKEKDGQKVPEVVQKAIDVPVFNADSAYTFVKAQTDFGPSVPGSQAPRECALWLEQSLRRYTDDVVVQNFRARAYNHEVLNGKNIIASFNKDAPARVMLAAHWDTRPYADHDPDPAFHRTPIDGANDGASGTGVLLEIARLLQDQQPGIGVDIILFDLEDYGPPQDSQNERANEAWGLGSQYWSKNPHQTNYRARFVILLDMVGAKDARFLQEGFSMYYAPDKVKKVWDIAHRIGYQDYFINEKGGYINDDHYYINMIRKIPAIDIIHLDPRSSNGSFFEHWHTTEDSIDKIDRKTLKVVGEVLMQVLFEE